MPHDASCSHLIGRARAKPPPRPNASDARRDVLGVGAGAKRVQNGAVSCQLEGKFALVFVPFYPLARQYSH